MNNIKRGFICSIIGSVCFAHVYALCERWFNFDEVKDYLGFLQSTLPSFGVIEPYNYVFMFAVFLFISSLPLLPLLFSEHWKVKMRIISIICGNALLTSLVEDMAYFYLYGMWIQPFNWTVQTFGYFVVGGYLVPYWYPPVILLIGVSYIFSYREIISLS